MIAYNVIRYGFQYGRWNSSVLLVSPGKLRNDDRADPLIGKALGDEGKAVETGGLLALAGPGKVENLPIGLIGVETAIHDIGEHEAEICVEIGKIDRRILVETDGAQISRIPLLIHGIGADGEPFGELVPAGHPGAVAEVELDLGFRRQLGKALDESFRELEGR